MDELDPEFEKEFEQSPSVMDTPEQSANKYLLRQMGSLPNPMDVAMGVSGGVKSVKSPTQQAGKLAMDEASRMARAKEMGFDTSKTFYHGTNKDFTEFDISKSKPGSRGIGFYFSDTKEIPEAYSKNGKLMEVHLKDLEKSAPFDKAIPKEDLEKIKTVLHPEMYQTLKNNLDLEPGQQYGQLFMMLGLRTKELGLPNQSQELAKALGISGIHVPGREHVVFNPENIRSTKAAFDPKKAKSANIMAGTAGAALGLGASQAGASYKDKTFYAEGGDVPEQMVNVLNPENQLVSIPAGQLAEASDYGYREASPEDIRQYQLQQKYGTPIEQAKTFAESALKGSTFGLSTGIETMAGVKPEDIAARQEANPWAAGTGEVAGLVGSSFVPGLGEGWLLNKAGMAASKAAGLEGAGALSKIGSAAVRGAVENAMVQTGDEVSRMFYQDPNQTAQTALVDIGLASLLGGGFGAGFGTVGHLWKSTVGEKLGQYLDALKRRGDGEALPLPTTVSEAITKSGIEVAPELRAYISQDPEFQRMFGQLAESTTRPGLKAQEGIFKFKKDLSDAALSALGKSEKDIPLEISEASMGKGYGDSIKSYLDERLRPIAEGLEGFKSKTENALISDEGKHLLGEKIAGLINDKRFDLYPDTEQAKLVNRMLEAVPKLKTIGDLNKSIQIINDATNGFAKSDMWHVGGLLRRIYSEAEDLVAENTLATKVAPEELAKYREYRKLYGGFKEDLEAIGKTLRLGSFGGPKGFTEALAEKISHDPEAIARAINSQHDATLLSFLEEKIPGVADMVRKNQMDKLLFQAASKAKGEHLIDANTLYKAVDKMTPEMKKFLLGPESEMKLEATRTLLNSLPAKMNTSGTAKTLDALWSKLPGGAVALASMALGHNPVMGYFLGQAAKWVARDAPDAVRLAFLKFLGQSGPVKPEAFKLMVDYAHATMQGETIIIKATKAIFKPSLEVLSRKYLPNAKTRSTLDKHLQEYKVDPSKLINTGGETSYYLPEHGAGLSEVAARSVNYLNGMRPSTDKLGVLDPMRQPSEMEKQDYARALDIAQQPAMVLMHIKNGTLVPQDIVHLQHIYPGLYERMSQKIMGELTDHLTKGNDLPYKTRIGLSMFLAQPLDSSLTPQAIQLSQSATSGLTQNEQSQRMAPGPGKTQALNKMPGMFRDSTEARLARKNVKV